jgi:hypothetical protein
MTSSLEAQTHAYAELLALAPDVLELGDAEQLNLMRRTAYEAATVLALAARVARGDAAALAALGGAEALALAQDLSASYLLLAAAVDADELKTLPLLTV